MNKFASVAMLLASVYAIRINPGAPTGLEPPPRTVDLDPLVHQQLRKPLIPENRNSENDLMNVQVNPLEVSFDREEEFLGTGHGAGSDTRIHNHEGEVISDRRFFAHEEPFDFVQLKAKRV